MESISGLSVSEILRKVQRIEILARRQVNELMAGGYQSVFKGRGMEFEEVREYQPGDDIRSIDWNVTARSGRPFIKRYAEERELTVMFLVDLSASGMFGSQSQSKLDLALEVAALLMFTALKNNDKVGLVLFCDQVGHYIPPRKGKSHVLRCLRELVASRPIARQADFAKATEFLGRVQKRRGVVFLLSDFLGIEDFQGLAVTGQRHDLIAVSLDDPRERSLPDVGLLRLLDPESGELRELDTSSAAVRQAFEQRGQQRRVQLQEGLARAGLDHLPLHTGEAYLQTLLRFFQMRRRRMH
ncbi:MAG: DUF58 domain-containing protein [Planctomycetota bacterium]|nr:MAG: DUF58 domain-containing protein [Planctomycetota bacterium]